MTTNDATVELPTLEMLKKRTSVDRWRSAYVVFWTEVIFREGKIVSEFDVGSTLYTIVQDAEKAKQEARDRRINTGRDGIYKLARHRGSLSDTIVIPVDFYHRLISQGREDTTFTTMEQWGEYYERRIAKLRYSVVPVVEGHVLLGPLGEFIADFPKNISNPFRIKTELNSALDSLQRLKEEIADR